MRYLCLLLLLSCSLAACGAAEAATYYVDQSTPAASDQNAGTAARPWKTINRAAGAPEVMPGDTVFIKSGVYREAVRITRSGTAGKPVAFAAAPGERVVIKGSTMVTGAWTRVTGDPDLKEPYPNAFANVWKIHLDDSYFQGLPPEMHYLSTVFLSDSVSLQQIGTNPIYRDPNLLSPVGKDLSNIYLNSFYFDPASQTLYIDIDGRPEWFGVEVGTIPYPLSASNIHDVNISGLQIRQNRQPGGQWSMSQIQDSERIHVSDCAFAYSDFSGFSLARCKNCTVTHCSMNSNGDVGFGFSQCVDCLADGCVMNHNNTRHFSTGWHAGGVKSIPGNHRCSIENCEVAYNNGNGIWFDDGNGDCRIIHNVVHHNETGIFYEISPGGAVIADNLVFANRSRGIYISGSKGCRIIYNTVAENNTGICIMPRGDEYPVENNLAQNNLCLHNVTAQGAFRGCELTVFMCAGADGKRTAMTNHSQSNLYAAGLGQPTLRAEWNIDIKLNVWQQQFGEDQGSQAAPIAYQIFGDTFRLTDPQAAVKRAIATPLPDGLPWKPKNPKLVGSSLTSWP